MTAAQKRELKVKATLARKQSRVDIRSEIAKGKTLLASQGVDAYGKGALAISGVLEAATKAVGSIYGGLGGIAGGFNLGGKSEDGYGNGNVNTGTGNGDQDKQNGDQDKKDNTLLYVGGGIGLTVLVVGGIFLAKQ
jgi:hypothetical protein